MTGDWKGKVVMITGGGGGLGRVVTRRFAEAGAMPVMVERDEATRAELTAAFGGLAAAADVTNPDSVEALVRLVEAEYGRIDALAHTVGGFASGQAVHESGLDVWERMMALNARSVYVTCGRVARHMVAGGIEGRIVAVLARPAYRGAARMAAYAASKAAAQRVIESMAAELAGYGITVNAVAPGTIDTPANRAAMPSADFSKWVAPDDIAGAILFLAANRAVSGHTLDVFGRT